MAETPNMQCTLHNQNDMVMVCTTCKGEMVCLVCIATEHKGHEFSVLSEVQCEKREKLRKFVSTVELIDVVKLRNKIGMIQMKRSSNKRISTSFYGTIHARGDKIKSSIDEAVQKVIEGSAAIEKRHDELLDTSEKKLRYAYSGLVSFIKQCRDSLDTATYEEMMEWERQLKIQLADSEEIDTIPDIRFPHLTDCDLSSEHLNKIVGLTQILLLERKTMIQSPISEVSTAGTSSVLPKHEPQYSIETINSFVLGTEDVRVICSVGDIAWIGCYTKKIMLVDKEGNVLCEVGLDCFTNDMTRCSNGSEVLLSCFDGTVRKIFQDGSQEIVFQNSDKINCITSFSENEILLGMLGKLTKCSMQGQILQVFEEQDNGNPFITFPRKLSVNPINNDVVIVNWDPSEIVVLDKQFSLKFRYRGEADLIIPNPKQTSFQQPQTATQTSFANELQKAVRTRNETATMNRKIPEVKRLVTEVIKHRSQKFHPYDISFDNNGNVHILDYDSKTIQILNSDGDFLETLKLCREGVLSLDFDEFGDLWLGGRRGNVRVVRPGFPGMH